MKRNARRFPEDFSFVLTRPEFDQLISQNAISKPNRGGRTKLSRVFTEHGALMAASVLNSDRAVAMSVYVIRAFVEMRETLTANDAILKRLAEIGRDLIVHGSALQDIYRKLLPLLPPHRRSHLGDKSDSLPLRKPVPNSARPNPVSGTPHSLGKIRRRR